MKTKAKPTEMLSPDGEPLWVIEYRKTRQRWRPIVACTSGSQYDFDWCELDGVLVQHCSGFGRGISDTYDLYAFAGAPKISAKLWIADGVQLTSDKKPIGKKEARAMGYRVITEPLDGNPFSHAIEDETEYCVECEDHHPTEQMCNHVQYKEGMGYTLGCGACEVDFGETQASLYRLLRMLPKDEIRRICCDVISGLCPEVRARGKRYGDRGQSLLREFEDERRYEERYWPGIAWLLSLDGPCPDARALTVGWLWMFERAGWRACCYAPEHQFVRHLPASELTEWLAIDPLDPMALRDRPLRVKLDFNPGNAHDIAFLKNPLACSEVSLWPMKESDGSTILEHSLTLSVAEVRRAGDNAVDIYFGSVIERNGRRISAIYGDDQ